MHTSNVLCFFFLVAAAASECEADSGCAGEKDAAFLLQSSIGVASASSQEQEDDDLKEEDEKQENDDLEEDYEKPDDGDLAKEEEKAAADNALIESIADLEDGADLEDDDDPPKVFAVRVGFNGGGGEMRRLYSGQAKFYTTADCTGEVVTGTPIGTSKVWKTRDDDCDEKPYHGCEMTPNVTDGVDKNGWTGWSTSFCYKGCENSDMFMGYKFDKAVQILSFEDGFGRIPPGFTLQRALEWAGKDTVWETVTSERIGEMARYPGLRTVGLHRRRESGRDGGCAKKHHGGCAGQQPGMCKPFSIKKATFTVEKGKWCGDKLKEKPYILSRNHITGTMDRRDECWSRCVYDVNCHSYEVVYGHNVSHPDCCHNIGTTCPDGVCPNNGKRWPGPTKWFHNGGIGGWHGFCIIRTTDDCEHQDPPIKPIEKGAGYVRYFKDSKAGVHTEKCLTHEGDEDAKTCYTKCAPGFYESIRAGGKKAKSGNVCVECQGGTSRRRNYECSQCRPGWVSKDESDECQLLQDLCKDPDECGACLTCMSGIEGQLGKCVTKPIEQGGCYNPGTTWCSEAQDALLQCQTKSTGCWYRLLCRDPRICVEWKSVFCGPPKRLTIDGKVEHLWSNEELSLKEGALLARANLSVDVSLKDDSVSLDESLSGKRCVR